MSQRRWEHPRMSKKKSGGKVGRAPMWSWMTVNDSWRPWRHDGRAGNKLHVDKRAVSGGRRTKLGYHGVLSLGRRAKWEKIEPQGIINGICMGLFHILKDASGKSKTIHLSMFEPSTMKTWSRLHKECSYCKCPKTFWSMVQWFTIKIDFNCFIVLLCVRCETGVLRTRSAREFVPLLSFFPATVASRQLIFSSDCATHLKTSPDDLALYE